MQPAITLFLACVIVLIFAEPVAAFGAGSIPNYAYLNDKAFRHGDIDEVLMNLVKSHDLGDGGLMSFIAYLFSLYTGGNKFSKMDMKRIYFGNWLRDYSQAMDIAGLRQLTAQTLHIVVSVLGFMTFGFATAEFEITPERLGVYLPVEHIDNPKGYAANEGDARQIHPLLRPPVDPRELEINPHNGMKNYIATEGESWDTSTAHIRRTLQECIKLGRKARGKENDDQWEAFRLLGTALHTLEDLLAHSNWCELGLRKLGHKDVFCHVGDAVLIETPSGPAPPLVTGTFGSADFMHSVLGEGMDRLSEASVSNLVGKINEAKSKGDGLISVFKSLLAKLPSSGGTTHDEKIKQAENIKDQAFDFDPDDVAPEELQRQLWQILEWRDAVYKDVLKAIALIPGLSMLFEELTEALNAFVFTILDPVLKPLLQEATEALHDSSKAVIDTDDQYEVFNDPHASDPSHSILAKDHFGLILNEPAGKIAQVVVAHSVNLVVKAWSDDREDPNIIIDKVLEAFHHPNFSTENSEIQRQMMDHLKKWLAGIDPKEVEKTLQALTKESVREGNNNRVASDAEVVNEDVQRFATTTNGAENGQINHDQNAAVPNAKERYDREILYEIQPSAPIYERFDGQHKPRRRQRQRQAAMADKQSRTFKSDDDFWKNPYAKGQDPFQYQGFHPEGRNSRFRSGYTSYNARQPYDRDPGTQTEGAHGLSDLLVAAESGYYAGFGRRQYGRQQRQYSAEASGERHASRGISYDGRRNEESSPGLRSPYDYTGGGRPYNGQGRGSKGPSGADNVQGDNQDPQLHGTGLDFQRYATLRGRYVATHPEQPEVDFPPAFYVRTHYPEVALHSGRGYAQGATYDGREKGSLSEPGNYDHKEKHDVNDTEKTT